MNAVGWCFVEASIKNSFKTSQCMDKSGQENRDELAKLKNCQGMCTTFHGVLEGEGRTGRSFDALPLQPRPTRRVGHHTGTVAPYRFFRTELATFSKSCSRNFSTTHTFQFTWRTQKSGMEAVQNEKHAPHCRLQPGTAGVKIWELQWDTKRSFCTNWRRKPQPTLSFWIGSWPSKTHKQFGFSSCSALQPISLRTVNPELTFDCAARHDSRCWQCFCRILRPDNPNAKMIAAVVV